VQRQIKIMACVRWSIHAYIGYQYFTCAAYAYTETSTEDWFCNKKA